MNDNALNFINAAGALSSAMKSLGVEKDTIVALDSDDFDAIRIAAQDAMQTAYRDAAFTCSDTFGLFNIRFVRKQ